jgi:DNA-binding NtrC family response regulator
MGFVGGGQEALEAYSRSPFDVVVSDMRMPNMDGADLLTEIKRLYPDSIRIILSGQSDAATIMKSVGPAHLYLAKPCDSDELKATIERAYALRRLIGSDSLRQLISTLEALPSIPAAYQEIVACFQDSEASLENIAGIIGKDVGMTAKILKLANSAFFGLATSVNSVERAVSFLG